MGSTAVGTPRCSTSRRATSLVVVLFPEAGAPTTPIQYCLRPCVWPGFGLVDCGGRWRVTIDVAQVRGLAEVAPTHQTDRPAHAPSPSPAGCSCDPNARTTSSTSPSYVDSLGARGAWIGWWVGGSDVVDRIDLQQQQATACVQHRLHIRTWKEEEAAAGRRRLPLPRWSRPSLRSAAIIVAESG